MARPTVVLGGGSRSLKLRIAPEVFLQIPGAEVVADLATPPPAR
jgi:prolyl-tRNA editing enzyme YbaK/EbsC (Cys-tRNA(Pro) deacylase)